MVGPYIPHPLGRKVVSISGGEEGDGGSSILSFKFGHIVYQYLLATYLQSSVSLLNCFSVISSPPLILSTAASSFLLARTSSCAQSHDGPARPHSSDSPKLFRKPKRMIRPTQHRASNQL